MSAGPLTPSLLVMGSFSLFHADGLLAYGSFAMSERGIVSWKRDQFTRGLKSGESAKHRHPKVVIGCQSLMP
jgi:hypothetical protein